MTDQPDPVGLKKEISGHPTDHSRKALQAELDGTAAELRDAHIEIAFLKKSIEKLQSLQATLVRVASNPTIQAHVELARKEFAEGRSVPLEQSSVAPSLPEEGGQRRTEELASIFRWLLGMEGEFPLSEQGKRYGFRTELRARLEAIGFKIEAGASTLGERP